MKPTKPTTEKRVITFRIKLTQAERDKIDELAAEQGETPSQYIRRKVLYS